MAATLRLIIAFFFLSPAPGAARDFRFAVALGGSAWDFGKNFHANNARISLQTHLAAMYPNVQTTHVFDVIPEDFSPLCDARFLVWLQQGVDLVIGMLGHQPCLLNLAGSWPNVTFAAYLAGGSGPRNFVSLSARVYEPLYLAGYIAGLTTTSKKICISANVRRNAPVLFIAGFSRGVRMADPSVAIHLMETGATNAFLTEQWIVNQSYAMGCDVVFVQSVSIDGCVQAQSLGLKCVSLFSDARRTVGEYVITSALVDPTPLFFRLAEALLNGTLQKETKKADWWMGWDRGAVSLAAPSFLVPDAVAARAAALAARASRVFCGRTCTAAGCLCANASCCVSDAQLKTMLTYPDFVTEHGVLQLPGRACQPGQLATWHLDTFTMQCTDCPAGTYAYNADQVSECRPCPAATYSLPGATECVPCPAGTHNDRLQGQCTECPAGTIAANPGATKCNVCLSGISSSDRTECEAASLLWLAGVGGGIGLLLLLVGGWGWWQSRRMRAMKKQFSNDHVAVECAAAIARLDLQAVAWLSDIPKPNCIQLSFIRIVRILHEVRKYVPDQLLQSLAGEQTGDGGGADPEAEGEVDEEVPMKDAARHPSSIVMGSSRVVPVTASVHTSSISDTSLTSRLSQGDQGLLAIRKVTYLAVQFNMDQHQSTASQAETNLKAFMSHLVDTARAEAGTLGTVTFDRAVVHWGTGRRCVAEAPKHAVQTALALASFAERLSGGAELRLNISIGCGNALTGVVETATNHFFVVGGGPVPVVDRVVARDCFSTMGVQILITDAVRASVQYSYLCHPRLLDGTEVLWEPVLRKKEKTDDEWMYQLNEGEDNLALTPAALLVPFKLMRRGEYSRVESLIRDIQQRHSKDLQPKDLAALQWLACQARACKNSPTVGAHLPM